MSNIEYRSPNNEVVGVGWRRGILLAVVVMALLYWFTAHFNVRMGS